MVEKTAIKNRPLSSPEMQPENLSGRKQSEIFMSADTAALTGLPEK